jgi:Zn-dependent M28 family amino/carboxypeptidase
MNKNTIAILLIIFVVFHIYGVLYRESIITPVVIQPPKVIELTHNQILDCIKKEDIKTCVEKLASKEFDGRGTGTEGNIKAAQYIKSHLDSLKIPYKEQEFSVQNRKTKNIIAYISPKIPKSDNIIVIGAHFDHLGSRGSTYYPGADDNASGVAGVMAVATALSKYKDKLNHTVLLQFYSAEELGLIGSKYYVNNPLFPISRPDINKHSAMINLDMIGYLRKSYMDNENVTSYRNCKEWIVFKYGNGIDLKKIVDDLSSKYDFAKNISGYRPGGSDHAPFYNKGVPVVFLHTGSHAHYHKPSDTPDKLNYEGLTSVTKLALEILIKTDKDL